MGGSAEVSASDVIHVSVDGNDDASGGPADPVRTVTQAVRLAGSGDAIEIASGRYHESVQVYAKQVHLRAAPGADVVLDGASSITDWTAANGRWWARWHTDFNRAGHPFTTDERPEAGWPEQFFVDERNLVEVTKIASVGPGTFFHDRSADRVWVGDDPSGRAMAGSDLSWGLYLNRADGSSVTGIDVERYATETRHMAAVRAYGNDLRLEDVTVVDNARIGVSVMGERVRLDDVRAISNGHLGIHGHRSDGLVVSDSDVLDNNRERFDAFHSAGGIKVTESTNLLVDGSRVIGNRGPGVWTDLDTQKVAITSNLITRNARSGVEIELSERVVVADNTVHANGEAGVWVLESRDVDVWHNSVLNNVRDVWIEDGPRDDVQNVTVVNNLLGGDAGNGAVGAVLNVDDWTEQRSADAMNVFIASNRYWLVPGSKTSAVSRWAAWPRPLEVSKTISEHVAATGGGEGSDVVVSGSDPFSRSASDARQPDGSKPGRAPIASVVGALAMSSSAAPIGPLSTLTTITVQSGGPVEMGRVTDTRDGFGDRASISGVGAASLSGARFIRL